MSDVFQIQIKAIDQATGILNQVKNSLKSMSEQTKQAKNNFLTLNNSTSTLNNTFSKLKGLIATVGLSLLAKMGLDMAGNIEKASIQFGVLTKNMELGKTLYSDLLKLSASTPLNIESIASATKTLLSFGSSIGIVKDQVNMLGDIAMGDAQKLESVARAFGKIQAKGYASMEELNILIDAGVPIIGELAKMLSVSNAEIIKMTSNGQISFDNINQAMINMTSQGGSFYRMMKKLSETLAGLKSTALDNLKLRLADFFNVLMPGIKQGLTSFINFLSNSENLFTTMGIIIKNVILTIKAPFDLMGYVFKIINNYLKNTLGDAYNIIKSITAGILGGGGLYIAIALLLPVLSNVINGVKALGVALKVASSSPIVLIIMGIVVALLAIITIIRIISNDTERFFSIFANLLSAAKTLIAGFSILVKTIFSSLFQELGIHLDSFSQHFFVIFDILAEVVKSIFAKIIVTVLDAINSLIEKINSSGVAKFLKINLGSIGISQDLKDSASQSLSDIVKENTDKLNKTLQENNQKLEQIKKNKDSALDEATNLIKKGWDGVKEATGELAKAFKDNFQSLFSKNSTSANQALKTGNIVIPGLTEMSGVSGVNGQTGDAHSSERNSGSGSGIFVSFLTFIKSFINNIKNLENILKLLSPLQTFFNAFLERSGELFNTFLAPLVNVFENLGYIAAELFIPILYVLTPLIDTIISLFSKLLVILQPFSYFIQIIAGIFGELSGVFVQLINMIMPLLEPLLQLLIIMINIVLLPLFTVLKLITPFLSLLQIILTAIAPILTFFANGLMAIAKIFLFIYNYVFRPIGNGLITIFVFVMNIFIGIKNAIATVFNAVSNFLKALGINLGTMAKSSYLSASDYYLDQASLETSDYSSADLVNSVNSNSSTNSSNYTTEAVRPINIYIDNSGVITGFSTETDFFKWIKEGVDLATSKGY